MRRLCWACLFIILLAIIAGCTQPATPAPEFIVVQTTTPLPPAVTTTPIEKQLSFTVTSSKSMVNITYNGGPDVADLESLYIRVYNLDGSYNDRTIVNPTPGSSFVFTYRAQSDATRISIIGTFKGGYQQTVLMYYLR